MEIPAGGRQPARPRTERLRKRSDFLRLNRGHREATRGFVLLGRDRQDGEGTIRTGFTCSKKLGGAVSRNRAKRRLREIARLALAPRARPGWDYVLIGRRDTTASMPFETLCADLVRALENLHSDRP